MGAVKLAASLRIDWEGGVPIVGVEVEVGSVIASPPGPPPAVETPARRKRPADRATPAQRDPSYRLLLRPAPVMGEVRACVMADVPGQGVLTLSPTSRRAARKPKPLPPRSPPAPQTDFMTLTGLIEQPELASSLLFWPPHKHRRGPKAAELDYSTPRLAILTCADGGSKDVHRWPSPLALTAAGAFSSSAFSSTSEDRNAALERKRERWAEQKEQRLEKLREKLERRAEAQALAASSPAVATPRPTATARVRRLPRLAHRPSLHGFSTRISPRRSPRHPSPRGSPRASPSGADDSGKYFRRQPHPPAYPRAINGRRPLPPVGPPPRSPGQQARNRHEAALSVQAHYRGYRERAYGRRAELGRLAPHVQKAYRGHVARRTVVKAAREAHEERHRSCRLIQGRLRYRWSRQQAAAGGPELDRMPLSERISLISVELDQFDGMRAALHDECARTIQSAWRAYLGFSRCVRSALLLQRAFREAACRQKARKTRKARPARETGGVRRPSHFSESAASGPHRETRFSVAERRASGIDPGRLATIPDRRTAAANESASMRRNTTAGHLHYSHQHAPPGARAAGPLTGMAASGGGSSAGQTVPAAA